VHDVHASRAIPDAASATRQDYPRATVAARPQALIPLCQLRTAAAVAASQRRYRPVNVRYFIFDALRHAIRDREAPC